MGSPLPCQASLQASRGSLAGPPFPKGSAKQGYPADGAAAQAEGIKEKELLLALGRRGKLTAEEAAPESSLSVEEANRMLFELAAKGHLQLIVEHGRLYYAFWERD